MYSYLASYLSQEEIADLKSEMDKSVPDKGFILNNQKATPELIKDEFPSAVEDPANKGLFRYDPLSDHPGKNLLHEGGAYYILDPSAAEAISVLGTGRQDFVLDMCAAPGGKTIAFALNNPKSLIIANDISPLRAQELSKNVERLGLSNVIVTSYDPKVLLQKFPRQFSLVILDAPCSGTGMFRKEEKMKEDWSIEKTASLLSIQKSLLSEAYAFLKEGGELMYLTCSFLSQEDEDQISGFLSAHSDMKTEDIIMKKEYREGKVKNTVHLLPSLFKGEGHFFALLKKEGTLDTSFPPLFSKAKYDENLKLYTFSYRGEEYGLNYVNADLISLYALRFGLKITNSVKYAKSPYDHALSHYPHEASKVEMSLKEGLGYLAGEEIKAASSLKDGLYIMSYKGVGLGFGLKKGPRIHNLLPKGLRKRFD